MKCSFFVYGIYDENQKCHQRFKDFIVSKQKAHVKGSIHLLSSGMGLLDPAGDDLISGHLIEIEAPESYLAILDALCGFDPLSIKKSFVLRSQVLAFVAEAPPVSTMAYCLNTEQKLSDLRILRGADLENYLNHKTEGLIDKITERQKAYIQKLAQAKGREIVPVDLALYRELISLELIVDKGRRMALSRRGTELSWFL